MGNVYKPVGPGLRSLAEYREAKALLEEKRIVMARVVEIDRVLRKLSSEDPAAVEAARTEMPFRRPHGRVG